MSKPNKVIHDAATVAKYLRNLKAEKNGAPGWWVGALTFTWGKIRASQNTWWCTLEVTINGVRTPMYVRVKGISHCGQIMPATEAGVAELAARFSAKASKYNTTIKKRDRKPCFLVKQFDAEVKTAEDGISLTYGADGNAILPGEDKRNPYYELASYVNEAFTHEAKEMVDNGSALMAKISSMKRANKAATAQEICDAYVKEIGGTRPNYIALSTANVADVKKLFAKDHDILLRGAITCPSTKVASVVQETVSQASSKNAGATLPNPMTRIQMEFDKDTGVAKTKFYDKDAPFTADGKQKYEEGKVDGDPVCSDNIHKFVTPRCVFDGIIDMSSVCISSMGISMPIKAEVVVVSKPSGFQKADLDDLLFDEDGNTVGDAAPAAKAPAPASAPAPAPAPASAPAPAPAPAPTAKAPAAKAPAPKAPADDNEYGDLLDQLGGQ